MASWREARLHAAGGLRQWPNTPCTAQSGTPARRKGTAPVLPPSALPPSASFSLNHRTLTARSQRPTRYQRRDGRTVNRPASLPTDGLTLTESGIANGKHELTRMTTPAREERPAPPQFAGHPMDSLAQRIQSHKIRLWISGRDDHSKRHMLPTQAAPRPAAQAAQGAAWHDTRSRAHARTH